MGLPEKLNRDGSRGTWSVSEMDACDPLGDGQPSPCLGTVKLWTLQFGGICNGGIMLELDCWHWARQDLDRQTMGNSTHWKLPRLHSLPTRLLTRHPEAIRCRWTMGPILRWETSSQEQEFPMQRRSLQSAPTL